MSESLVAENSDEEESFVPRNYISNAQEDISAYNKYRYSKQQRSSNGKVAYVVFSGHDVGVFYNW